jgi:alpha-mannosidase
LFAYSIDLPAGARTIKLPDNQAIRILAISVADENPEVRPVQPLYDVLPAVAKAQ